MPVRNHLNDARWDLIEPIYIKYYKSLTISARQYTSNRQEAEDAVQDIFFKLYTAGQQFENGEDPLAYLTTSLRNWMITRSKKKKKENNIEADTYRTALHPANRFESREAMQLKLKYNQLFDQYLHELPTRQREVLLLCLKEKSTQEIAELLDISTQTVLNTKNTAIKSMYHKLLAHRVYGLYFYILFDMIIKSLNKE